MPLEKVYQIFVSSTYSDLQQERRLVSDTLAKAGFIPAGMELFPATDQQQLEFIKRVIDRCDYYVVILGGRYDTLSDNDLSYTEKEYEYAVDKRIPVLAFLHAKPEKIEAGKTEADPLQRARLERFRKRLASGRIVDFWASPKDLCTRVLTAVVQATNLMPGTGWVRGDQAIDPKLLLEMEQLRTANIELRERLTETISPPDIPGPEQPFQCEVHYVGQDPKDPSTPWDIVVTHDETFRASPKLGDIFIALFETILEEPTESSLCETLGHIVARLVQHEGRSKYNDYTLDGSAVGEHAISP